MNIYEEDLLYNYLALAVCVVYDNVTVDNAITVIVDNARYTKRNTNTGYSTKNKKIVLIDTLYDEDMVFESQGEASSYLGIHRNIAGIYVKSGKLYKERYYFRALE